MVLNEIGQSFILPSGFDVASTRKVEEVLTERRAIGIFPTGLDRADDRNEVRCIAIGFCTRRQQ